MTKVDRIDNRVKEYLEDAGEVASYTKGTLGRKFEELLIINTAKSSNTEVVPSFEFIFLVYKTGRRYIICLERKVCSCGRFQIDEIPCSHAIAPDALAKTYEIPMVPKPDKED
ncbi:hypothetical protein EJD97_016844, partial [Solanum chilense]